MFFHLVACLKSQHWSCLYVLKVLMLFAVHLTNSSEGLCYIKVSSARYQRPAAETKPHQEPERSVWFACLCSTKLSEENQRPKHFSSASAKIQQKYTNIREPRQMNQMQLNPIRRIWMWSQENNRAAETSAGERIEKETREKQKQLLRGRVGFQLFNFCTSFKLTS